MAAFVALERSAVNKIADIINILLAFVLALLIEHKYRILDKLFKYRSRKYLFISLPIAIFATIEVSSIFLQSSPSENSLIVKILSIRRCR